MAASFPYFDLGIISTASERISHYERSKGMILFWVHLSLVIVLGIRRGRNARAGRNYYKFRLDYDKI